jgi:predicted enzyme related to lactoylglutathione lyase
VTSTIRNITFDCADPRALARFWGQFTGWTVDEEPQPGYPDRAVRPPDKSHPNLYFVQVPESKVVKNRVHLDLEPDDRTQDEEIARLVTLGATVVHDDRPEHGWVIMNDPGGNEFCLEMSAPELAAAQAAEAAHQAAEEPGQPGPTRLSPP